MHKKMNQNAMALRSQAIALGRRSSLAWSPAAGVELIAVAFQAKALAGNDPSRALRTP
jgi:hypothetical protein